MRLFSLIIVLFLCLTTTASAERPPITYYNCFRSIDEGLEVFENEGFIPILTGIESNTMGIQSKNPQPVMLYMHPETREYILLKHTPTRTGAKILCAVSAGIMIMDVWHE